MKIQARVLVGLTVLIGFLIASSALAGVPDSAWFYSRDGMTRYDPGTGIAQSSSGGAWYTDSHPATNPAFLEYHLSPPCSSGSTGGNSSVVCPDDSRHSSDGLLRAGHSYRQVIRSSQDALDDLSAELVRGIAIAGLVSSILSPGLFDTANTPRLFYRRSELPEWDWRLGLAGDTEKGDFVVDQAGARFESRTDSLSLSLNGAKERVRLLNSIRTERSDGRGAFRGVDSVTYGLRVMPGYMFMLQEADGVEAGLYGIADLSYVDTDRVESQYRVSPGAGAVVGHASKIGCVAAAYTLSHSRNVSGDDEVTGSHYVNVHSAALSYAFPITERVQVLTGLNHSYVPDTPSEVEDQFTYARIGLEILEIGDWDVALSYSEAIDGRAARGGSVSVGYRW